MTAVDTELESRYLAEDRERRLQTSKVGCWLAMTLMPAGALLDLMVYPDLLGSFFAIRMVATAAVVVIFLLHLRQTPTAVLRALNLAWVLAINAGICAMIAASEGASSPYYAGLNLVFLAMGLLMPLTWVESLICCSATIAMYLAATAVHGGMFDHPGLLFNNLYFLNLTALVCCVASAVSTRRRREDVRLRHEIDQRNAELAESYRKLADLDRQRTQFFANVSHELRTPLTLILGPLDDLLTGMHHLPDHTAESLGMARQNGLRLLKLINDLLEIVRLEDGRTEMDRRPLKLGPWLAGLVDSVRYLAEAKGLQLTMDGEVDDIIVLADAQRLEKVFINLITNAIKFTPSGGTITVGWTLDDDHARCWVEDTGIGIPSDQVEHVFERFRQVDGSTTRAFQGAGLGLALARELVEEHGGKLRATSEAGRGSRFEVDLPLDDRTPIEALATIGASVGGDRSAALHAQAERRGAIAVPEIVGEDLEVMGSGGPSLLVVDDEPDMRRYLVSGLAENHLVHQAADGLAAVERAAAIVPDLIVLDLMLPGIDGLEACSRIRAIPELADTKILLLTARVDEAAKLQALERGADDFLTKPFSFVEVKTRVANLLRTHRLQRELRGRIEEVESAMARLRATESQLVQSEKVRALGDMAAGVLHEMGNPLNYAMTALDLALLDAPEDLDDDTRSAITDAMEGLGRIKAIISDLKAFAYPTQSGSGEPFRLTEVVSSALRLSSGEIRELETTVDIPEGLQVVGSRDQLLHLFMNLITNAAKALNDRGEDAPPGRIAIAAETSDEVTRVRVSDNGVGIPADIIDRIFDPFFTTRDVQEGMGLGLSLCRTIAAHHGGDLNVVSSPGEGSTFTLTLHAAVTETAA